MNAAPVWNDAPVGPVQVGQGQTVELAVSVSDPDGDPVSATVVAPTTLEANVDLAAGTLTMHPGYSVSGTVVVTVSLSDDAGGVADVDVMVAVLPIIWSAYHEWIPPAGPAEREHPAAIIDEVGDRLLLFGGTGFSPQFVPIDDAWEMDLATGTWTPLTPAGDPMPGASSRRVAEIPGQQVAYVYGGSDASGASLDELYRVDFSTDPVTVTALTSVGAPPARSLHAFAYDPVSDRFVTFGGFGAGAVLGDTWVMTLSGDQATWSPAPINGPSPRYGFFWGMDQEAGELVVFSGAQGLLSINAASDSWALDFRSVPPAWRPHRRRNHRASGTSQRVLHVRSQRPPAVRVWRNR